MPEISFALIQSDNLANKNLKIEQIESVIEVKGKLDPYQIQAIRDAVSDSFRDRQKTINDLIRGKAKEAAKEKDPQKRLAIIADLDKALAKASAAFDKKIQASVTEFCAKDEKMQQAGSGTWSYLVSTAWSLGSLAWNASKANAETGLALATGGATAALAIKGLIDLANDIMKFYKSQTEAWTSVDAQEKKISTALAKIRKTKKGQPIAQSDIDAAELALAPFGSKIDALEKATRGFAERLDKMLNSASPKQITDKGAQKKLEDAIQTMVVKVADMGKAVADKRKAQSRAKDTIKTAMTKAKADPWSYVTWASGIYDLVNDGIDVLKAPEDLFDEMKRFVVVLGHIKDNLAE